MALRSVEEDGSTYWYRAKVVSVLPQESKVEVKLLDYGNTDVVEMKDVMLLPSKFYQLPFQAVHCCLRGLSDFLESPKIYETFMAYQDKPDLTAKVVARYAGALCGGCEVSVLVCFIHTVLFLALMYTLTHTHTCTHTRSPGTRVTLELMDQENIEKGSINVQLMSLGTPIAQLSPEMPSVSLQQEHHYACSTSIAPSAHDPQSLSCFGVCHLRPLTLCSSPLPGGRESECECDRHQCWGRGLPAAPRTESASSR